MILVYISKCHMSHLKMLISVGKRIAFLHVVVVVVGKVEEALLFLGYIPIGLLAALAVVAAVAVVKVDI